jgi:hypothetical protein
MYERGRGTKSAQSQARACRFYPRCVLCVLLSVGGCDVLSRPQVFASEAAVCKSPSATPADPCSVELTGSGS